MPPRKRAVKKAYWSEEGRLSSFTNWPFGNDVVCTAEKMAAAGFFCTNGKNDSADNVSCFMCGKDLDGWEEGDDPSKEHAKHCPSCPYGNLHLEENRLKTYKHWPHTKTQHDKAAFARAGFVHNPSGDAGWDNVRCFACDKNLGGWEKGDDPMEEHRRRGATCPFIQAQAAADAAEAAAATAIEEEAGAMQTEVAAPKAEVNLVASPAQEETVKAPSPFQAPKAAVAAALAPKEPAEMEMEIDDEMTVEQYLRHQCEMQTHQLIRACESRMTEFQEAAAGFRGQIEAH